MEAPTRIKPRVEFSLTGEAYALVHGISEDGMTIKTYKLTVNEFGAVYIERSENESRK